METDQPHAGQTGQQPQAHLPRSAVLTRSKSAEQKQQEMAAEEAAQAQKDQQQREVAAAERLAALQPDYESQELSALGDQGKAALQAAIAKIAAQAEEIAERRSAEAEASYRAANMRAEQEAERLHLQAQRAREQLQAVLPPHLHDQLQQASSADAQAVLLSSVRALIDAEPAQPKQMQSAAALPSAVVTPQLQQEQQRAPQTSIRAGAGGFEAALRQQTQAGQRVGFTGLPSLVQTPPQQQAAQFSQQPAFIPAQQQPSVASQGLLPQFNAAAAGAQTVPSFGATQIQQPQQFAQHAQQQPLSAQSTPPQQPRGGAGSSGGASGGDGGDDEQRWAQLTSSVLGQLLRLGQLQPPHQQQLKPPSASDAAKAPVFKDGTPFMAWLAQFVSYCKMVDPAMEELLKKGPQLNHVAATTQEMQQAGDVLASTGRPLSGVVTPQSAHEMTLLNWTSTALNFALKEHAQARGIITSIPSPNAPAAGPHCLFPAQRQRQHHARAAAVVQLGAGSARVDGAVLHPHAQQSGQTRAAQSNRD